jgi:hypothetical protein
MTIKDEVRRVGTEKSRSGSKVGGFLGAVTSRGESFIYEKQKFHP